MVSYLRDLTSSETEVILSQEMYNNLDRFFGKAMCLNVSNITEHGILDLHTLKNLLVSKSIDLSNYSILLLYTGHHDRYFNTSLWKRPRPFITYSALACLSSMGIKGICIDSPSPFGSCPLPMDLKISLTVGLSNIGHLCNKSFLYAGFPVPIAMGCLPKKYIPRAVAIQATL